MSNEDTWTQGGEHYTLRSTQGGEHYTLRGGTVAGELGREHGEKCQI